MDRQFFVSNVSRSCQRRVAGKQYTHKRAGLQPEASSAPPPPQPPISPSDARKELNVWTKCGRIWQRRPRGLTAGDRGTTGRPLAIVPRHCSRLPNRHGARRTERRARLSAVPGASKRAGLLPGQTPRPAWQGRVTATSPLRSCAPCMSRSYAHLGAPAEDDLRIEAQASAMPHSPAQCDLSKARGLSSGPAVRPPA